MSRADGEPGSTGRIEQEISTLRVEIGDLVGELDRRRREAFDLRLQARRHPVALSLAGLTVAVVLGGAVALLVRGRQRRRSPSHRARQLRFALQRAIRHPERIGHEEPPAGERILVAIGTAAATVLVKRALARAVAQPRAS